MRSRALPLTLVLCLLMAAVAMVTTPVLAQTPPKVVQVLRTTDKAQVNRYVPLAIELKHANPFIVAYFISRTARCEGGLVGTWMNPDGGGMLLIVTPQYQHESIMNVARQIDRPKLTTSSGSATQLVALKHRSSLDGDAPASLLLLGAADNAFLNDAEINSFFIQGSPSGIEAIMNAAAEYDVPTAQVQVAAKIYEVNVTNDLALGLDFQAWKNGPGQSFFALGADGFSGNATLADGVGGRVNMNWVQSHATAYSMDYPSEFFDFLSVKGKARVMTDMRVSALNGVAAEFRAIDEILYYPVSENSVGQRVVGLEPALVAADIAEQTGLRDFFNVAAEGTAVAGAADLTAADLMAVEAGLRLNVVSDIGTESINMQIQTTVNDFQGFDGAGIPQISTREMQTKVRAVSGEEVVLGRMTRTRDVKMTRKMPFFGSIPVIGYVFGGEVSQKVSTQVVEAITPTIIEAGGLTADDQETISQATGSSELPVTSDEYFFGQYFMAD